ncbi:hypothetical protein HDK77DRAFT_211094 [Phyllosticta capitalensis]|uniref:uncharacterized protein n=1 Tax=Phyllosticta capitalensis TaxID=121624 RepID=UPI00312E88ED
MNARCACAFVSFAPSLPLATAPTWLLSTAAIHLPNVEHESQQDIQKTFGRHSSRARASDPDFDSPTCRYKWLNSCCTLPSAPCALCSAPLPERKEPRNTKQLLGSSRPRERPHLLPALTSASPLAALDGVERTERVGAACLELAQPTYLQASRLACADGTPCKRGMGG